MPNKPSQGKKPQHFHCIYCERRLWRVSSPKHYLLFKAVSEIKQHMIFRENAGFLASEGIYFNDNTWIEEFCCGEHGRMWMLISKRTNGTLIAAPLLREDMVETAKPVRSIQILQVTP